MDTLPKDLLTLIFNVSNDNQIVDSFSLLYREDFLRIKYQSTAKYIDDELNKLFGEQRYTIFTKNSVLTGSFLLRLLLRDDWMFGDIDTVSSDIDFKIQGSLGSEDLLTDNMLDCIYYKTESYLFGHVDPHMFRLIKSFIKTIDMSNYRQLNKQVLNIISIDTTQTTIKEYIEGFDYNFVKNYAYYDGEQLQLFIYDYLSVFNKECQFKPSPLIWRSMDMYYKYKRRGFKIIWTINDIKEYAFRYVQSIKEVFGDLMIDFLYKTSTRCSNYVYISLLDDMRKDQQLNPNSIVPLLVLYLYKGLDINDQHPTEVNAIRDIFSQ